MKLGTLGTILGITGAVITAGGSILGVVDSKIQTKNKINNLTNDALNAEIEKAVEKALMEKIIA